MLVPPDNFGMVESGVYRCLKLDSNHFPFLETLQLKSLVLLDAEKPPRPLRSFVESNGIEMFNLGGLKISNHHHTGESSSSNADEDTEKDPQDSDKSSVNSRSTDKSDSETATKHLLNQIELVSLDISPRNKSDQWMLIEKNLIQGAFEIVFNKTKHNLLVVDLTLTFVGILRKIQKWNFNSIVSEYRIYTGNSSKSNYYAENFLELVQCVLLPAEIELLNNQQKSQKHDKTLTDPVTILLRSPELLRIKLASDDGIWDDENETRSIDDDDMDDDILSASPQIPANLLKLVEMKKQEKSNHDDDKKTTPPSSSPGYGGRTSRNNSFTNETFLLAARANLDRRRSSVDSKFARANNTFRNPGQSTPPLGSSFKSPFEPASPARSIKKGELSAMDAGRIRERYDFKYYKNIDKCQVSFENVGVIKLRLPEENRLPEWFIRSRNCWESNYRKLNL